MSDYSAMMMRRKMLMLLRLSLVTGLLVGSGHYTLLTWSSGSTDPSSKPDGNEETRCDKPAGDISLERTIANNKSETKSNHRLEIKDDGTNDDKEDTPSILPNNDASQYANHGVQKKKEW